MKKLVILLAVIVSFLSCKNEKKEIEENSQNDTIEATQEDKVENSFFTGRIVARVEKDDDFKLLFTEAEGIPFVASDIVISKVKGNQEFQTIEFKIKDNKVKPVRIRLDLGNNEEQQVILIKSCEFTQGDDSFFIEGQSLKKYFSPNGFVSYGNEPGEIMLEKKEGKYSPFLISKASLHEELYKF